MLSFEELLSCHGSCGGTIKIKLLQKDETTKSFDGIAKCETCTQKAAIVQSVLLKSPTKLNQSKITDFNQTYSENIVLEHESSSMIDFIENKQWTVNPSKFNFVKRTANFCFYSLNYLYIIIYLTLGTLTRTFKHINLSLKEEIKQLAEYYYYVPEMALYKLLEIQVLKENLKNKNINTILDIGGGNGQVFDILTGNLQITKKINIDLFATPTHKYDFILCEDILKSSLKEEALDCIVSISVLEHIPELQNIFKFAHKTLKQDGTLIFTTPKQDYYRGLILYRLLAIFSNKRARKYASFDIQHAHHCSLYSKNDMITLLKTAGFTDIKAIPFYPYKILSLFDLLNLSAKLPVAWHFWGRLTQFLYNKRLLKKTSQRLLEYTLSKMLELNERISNNHEQEDIFSHYLYIAKK